MNRRFIYPTRLALLMALLCIISCQRTKTKKENNVVEIAQESPPLAIIPGNIVSHASADGLSYSLYAPNGFSPEKKYSVIIFLDPQGKGSYPLMLYKSLADKFDVMLLGSNDFKNGLKVDDMLNIVQRILDECRSFPSFNGKSSLAGFSGGAKSALIGGNSTPGFTSIIYCGAALPARDIPLTTPMLGFAGNKDMNYSEVKTFSRYAKTLVKESGIVVWNGKHEWPDTTTFEHAFYWHLLSGNNEKNDTLMDGHEKLIRKIVNIEKNPLRKVKYLNNFVALIEKHRDVTNKKKEIRKIVLSPVYINAKKTEDRIIDAEELEKEEILRSFTTREVSWWKEKITRLKNNDSESNQRLLGYISLASWSHSSKSVAANDINHAMQALAIYEIADPENSEHQFLKACLYSKNNYPDSAVHYLNHAVKLGLNDRSKVENEKDLSTLRGRDDYRKVLAAIRNN